MREIPSHLAGDFEWSVVHSDVVRVTGLEPVRHETHAPQTCLSASSSTLAFLVSVVYYSKGRVSCQVLFVYKKTCHITNMPSHVKKTERLQRNNFHKKGKDRNIAIYLYKSRIF